jgi:stage III sporulation protein AD
MMELLIKAAVIAVVGAVITLVIKKNSPEMALLLAAALTLLILYFAADAIARLMGFIETLSDTAELSPALISIVMKTVGIAILTKLSADVCRDAGQSSVASGLELTGAAAALYVALPLMETVFSMINDLL